MRMHELLLAFVISFAVTLYCSCKTRLPSWAAILRTFRWVIPWISPSSLLLCFCRNSFTDGSYAALARMQMSLWVLPGLFTLAYILAWWVESAYLCKRHLVYELDWINSITAWLGILAVAACPSIFKVLPNVFGSSFPNWMLLLAFARLLLCWHVNTQKRIGGHWAVKRRLLGAGKLGCSLLIVLPFVLHLVMHVVRPGMGIDGNVSHDVVQIDQVAMRTSLYIRGGNITRRRERRVAKDGNAYTQEEFVQYYGGAKEWSDAERRMARDGLYYTKEDFLDYFGNEMEWQAARYRSDTSVGSLPSYAICSSEWEHLRLVDFAILSQLAYFDWDEQREFLTEALQKLFDGVRGVPTIVPQVGLSARCDGMNCSRAKFYQFDFHRLKVSVLAIRGTDPFNIHDIVQDARLWVEPVLFDILTSIFPTMRLWPAGATALYIQALNRMRDLFRTTSTLDYYLHLEEAIEEQRARYRDRDGWKFFVTGHSLGGGLAGIVGARLNLKSIAVRAV
eukprot:TRINITY_DN23296_c0_g1_i1.p1 TRINITY_DN23296_c0_g1~~TRINITY_DN23296_c0_g1_i1.p1  ORF type:complete len:506 (+),score=34.09 TRINITY_DN23296_c0_g1_i1:630-2147(+)